MIMMMMIIIIIIMIIITKANLKELKSISAI